MVSTVAPKIFIVLAAALAAAPAFAQSARTLPEPGLIPGPPSAENNDPASSWNPNTSQGLGQPGFGSNLPAGTRFGWSNQAGQNSQPTSSQGELYRANIRDYNVYPYRKTTPGGIGPQAPHKLPRVLIEPLPPEDSTPQPPAVRGGNVRR